MSRRSLLLVALLTTVWCAPLARAHACSCAPITPLEALAHATQVFEGRVIAISEPSDDKPLPHRKVTLAVVRSWKGVEAVERIVVNTALGDAACGYGFAQDVSYLVYARDTDGAPWASLCSGTRPMAEAEADLQALGMGQTPVDPNADAPPKKAEAEPPARGGCASCTVAGRPATSARAQLATLALASALYLRGARRRARRAR